jgi:protein O-GlcNAc transferase
MNEVLLRNANALLGLGRQREALDYYDRYLAMNPGSAEAWHNRGAALAQLKRYGDAVTCYDKALALRPDSAQSWNNRGNVLLEQQRYDEAPRDYEKALALDPAIPYALGFGLLAKLWCCDWTGLEEGRAKIASGLAADRRVIQPFGNLMISSNPSEHMRSARIWMSGRHGAPRPLWRGERYRHDRIRVAYLSGDFRVHPVAILMAGVFEHHDRKAYEIIAVSFGSDDKSALRARLAAAVERFTDVRGKTDFEIAAFLRENEVDVAVDLMGLTADCRSGILAHRPAPVQVNYLGFPGTMATTYMDYLIADRIVVPEEEKRWYGEKIVYLPDTYMATDSRREIAERTPSRAEAGLPERGFVFACFNNGYKLAPGTFDIWMRLLARVEGSVLWLPLGYATAQENLRREARARDVDPARLVFAPHTDSMAEHLARLTLADLFLDTLPCNAHATAVDALWAGLPVLTCAGTSFPGRVAASLLHAFGLSELIAHSVAEYEVLALRLARDPHALSAMRTKVARNRQGSALFDTARFARHLEAAFKAMVARHERGEAPASFAVEPVV